MKLIKSISIISLLASSTLLAQTTMCFKEKHNSMSTIESTNLDGGECKGSFSLNDMKQKGWSVDDIKITTLPNGTYNFIYILKDGQNVSSNVTTNSNLSESQLEAKIVKRMEEKKAQEDKEAEIKTRVELEKKGEELYISKCQSCHGQKGELEARGFSRPLNSLSLEESQRAIKDYNNGNYDRGLAYLMQPIATGLTYRHLEEVNAYLNKINK